MRTRADLTDKRVGRLCVIGDDERYSNRVICRCDCGKVKSILRTQLNGSHPTKSCGCLRRETSHKNGVEAAKNNFTQYYEMMRKYGTQFAIIERNMPDKRNKTGHAGVWETGNQKYVAYISVNGRKKHLGTFDRIEDAIRAREDAEEQYYKPLIAAKNSELQYGLC